MPTQATKGGVMTCQCFARCEADCICDHDWTPHVVKDMRAEIERLRSELAECCALLRRCLPIIESDAQMMADLSRFAPLDPVAQATHDATEYDSERLVREIPAALAKDDAARKGERE